MLTGVICMIASSSGMTVVSAAATQKIAVVEVAAGRHERIDVPVVVPASAKLLLKKDVPLDLLASQALELVPENAKGEVKPIPVQWQVATDPPMASMDTGALVFVLRGTMPADTIRKYALRVCSEPVRGDKVDVENDEGKALLLRCGGRSIARYNYGLVQRHPGKPSIFDRTAYFHPVWAPCGQIITDDFPKSHPHQRGVFLAWTRATIDKYKADFWNLGARRGKTVHKKLSHVVSGPVFGGFIADNECVANDHVAIKETWVTRAYALPAGPWIIDCDIRHTATDKDVVLKKYHYGGMAYRGRADWLDRKRLAVEASDGYDPKKGATESAKWIDMAGELPGGKQGGLLMIDHSSNPTYPTAARIHPSKPYFCFAFSRRAGYTIEAGKSLELRYRCVVHDGPPDRKLSERWAADFVDPPKVSIEPISKP